MLMTFISGSHAYGVPNEDSDIDLVIKVASREVALWLYEMLNDDYSGSDTPAYGSISIKHGKLNLICCWDENVYEIWRKGTIQLQSLQNKATREQAIALFENLRFNTLETNAKLYQAFNNQVLP
jgi:hypothetical protein